MAKMLASIYTNREKILYRTLGVFFVCSPFISLWLLLIAHNIDLHTLVPYWNDEISWFNQIKAVIYYGKPLGHYGYDGQHAAWGTFGPWGAAIIIFRACFAKIVGWHYYSPVLCNAFMLALSHISFLCFTKPSRRMLLYLIFAYGCLFICHLYILTAMSECTRIAIGIFLSGYFYYLITNVHTHKSSVHLAFIIAPIVVIACFFIYLLYAFFIPVVLYLLLERYIQSIKKPWQKIFLSGAVAFVIIVFLTWIHRHFCATYNTGSLSLIKGIILHPRSGLLALLRQGYENFKQVDFLFCLQGEMNDYGFVPAYLLFYYCAGLFTAIAFIYHWYKKDAGKTDILVYVLILFATVFTIGMSLFFYTGFAVWSYVRSISSSFALLLYLLCLVKANRGGVKYVLFLACLCILPYARISSHSFLKGRVGAEKVAELEKYEKIFAEYIHATPDASPWENTIIRCGTTYPLFAALPSGMSTNYILFNPQVFHQPKYAIFNKNEYDELRLQYEAAGFDLLYSDDVLFIYERPSQ